MRVAPRALWSKLLQTNNLFQGPPISGNSFKGGWVYGLGFRV